MEIQSSICFQKFLLNAYYVMREMEDWLFIHSFIQQILIEHLPKAGSDKHLSFLLFIYLIYIY